jgi:flagellar biosynthesis/type III secretory pathway protein FliH
MKMCYTSVNSKRATALKDVRMKLTKEQFDNIMAKIEVALEDVLDNIYEDAYDEGFDAGESQGYDEGYNKGYEEAEMDYEDQGE